ncbi:MAG: hypothetical protein HOE53_04250 [Candidatus Magasanikbacteria bacterium]|jgi:hypothetical protein|nr:hypothetical protein [Candidatus Magasanikbacteria bacterium]
MRENEGEWDFPPQCLQILDWQNDPVVVSLLKSGFLLFLVIAICVLVSIVLGCCSLFEDRLTDEAYDDAIRKVVSWLD